MLHSPGSRPEKTLDQQVILLPWFQVKCIGDQFAIIRLYIMRRMLRLFSRTSFLLQTMGYNDRRKGHGVPLLTRRARVTVVVRNTVNGTETFFVS
jgi:hypothetical protein